MRINVDQKNGNHCYYKKAYTKEMSRKLLVNCFNPHVKKNDIKKNLKRSLRKKQKPFGGVLKTSQSLPTLYGSEMDKLVEEVLKCGKPPLNTHISDRCTSEKPVG